MVVLREFKRWLTEMKDLKLHVSFNTNVQEWIHKAKYFTGVPVWKYTGKITLHMYSVIEWNREIMTEQTGIRIGPPDSLVRCSSNEAIWDGIWNGLTNIFLPLKWTSPSNIHSWPRFFPLAITCQFQGLTQYQMIQNGRNNDRSDRGSN